MKNNKAKKTSPALKSEEMEVIKPKKKVIKEEGKVNVRSLKFWEEIYEDEGDELERFLR
jgi:hypothetical protein